MSVFSVLHCVVSHVLLLAENCLLPQNTPARRGSLRSLATARGSLIQLRAAKKQTGNLTGALHAEKKPHDNTCFLVSLSRRKDYAWWHCIYQGAPHFVHELCICDLLHVLLPEVVAGYDWALRWWTRWYHQAGMGQGKVLHNHGCGCVTTCSDIHGHGGMVIFYIFSYNYWIVYYNSIIEVILCTYTL